tara:strand:- start:247 stop:897 length:651 start_codon:yes stop_codon:yes gene_type:complete
MDSIEINTLFPTMYAVRTNADHDKHKKSLLDFCYKYEKNFMHKDDAGVSPENNGGFEGVHNYYGSLLTKKPETILSYHELTPVFDFIKETLKQLNNKMKFTKDYDWGIENSWLNINRKYSMHRAHNHGSFIWSGIYYIQTDEKAAPLIFSNTIGDYRQHWPSMLPISKGEYNEYAESQKVIMPKEGQLILFPSWMIHSVPQHLDNEDRVNIAFNIS